MKLLFYTVCFIGICLNANSQWEQCNNGLTNLNIRSIAVRNNKIFVGTVGGGIFLSSDHGDKWYSKNIGISDTNVLSIAFGGNNIFAGSGSGSLYLSTDDGESWTSKSEGLSNSAVWSLAVNGNYIYLGTRDSGIYLSTDNGSIWLHKNRDLIYVRSMLAIDNMVLAGTYNTGIHLSLDSGNTWIERNNGLNDIDVRSLACNGKDLFAGTSALGIFHSSDTGLNWHNELIGSSSYGSVWAIAFFGKYLFLGSYDRGVFFSDDNGTIWTEKNQGIIDSSITLLAVSNKYIFSASSNGIYRAKLSDFGISDITDIENSSFSIYPNPAKDYIKIVCAKLPSPKQDDIRIYNALGKCVKKLYPSTSQGEGVRIDVSDLPAGVYFLRVGDKLSMFVKLWT